MASSSSLPVLILFIILTLAQVNATLDATTVASTTVLSPQTSPPPSPTATANSHDNHDQNALYTHTTALLAPILSHLGFNELSTAAPSLSVDTSVSSWSGPFTLFAPSDSSIHTCLSCSVPNLLREHLVPGLYTIDYLRKLSFGTKIETLSPGLCLTVTSTSSKNNNVSSSSFNHANKVFINGVEVTHPDLFNNGLVVIHGIQGYVAPLSPFSCDVERMNSLTFGNHNSHQQQQTADRFSRHGHQFLPQPAIMRLMIRDAMLRLRTNGFSILSLAMRVKYAELVSLSNMTMFALDDASIFTGSHSYISSIRFHIVPNVYLTLADLEKLPLGAALPTLERGQSLVVTTAAAGRGVAGSASTSTTLAVAPMRINYVRIKVGDMIRNLKIVVHTLYLPFPRIDPEVAAFDGILGMQSADGTTGRSTSVHEAAMGMGGSCTALNMDENGSCIGHSPVPPFKPTVDLEEYHGL